MGAARRTESGWGGVITARELDYLQVTHPTWARVHTLRTGGLTFREIAEDMGFSVQRARQIFETTERRLRRFRGQDYIRREMTSETITLRIAT